jgi:sulfur transfer complex TusBCD TusB component (DsrH family)
MRQIKKTSQFLLLSLLFFSCRLFRSGEQNAIHDIDKFQKKLNKIYAEYPQFRRVDTVETIVTIDNPIKEIDTVVLYQDTVIIEEVYNTIIRSCKDTSLAKKISKKVSNYRCIKDSIVIKDSLYKAVVRQDSLGIHVNIYPNDSTLSLKYKIPCTKNVIVGDEYWQHKEFWFLFVILLFTIAIVVLKIRF